jgi:hypothetical protein
LGDVSLFYSCCDVHWTLDAIKNKNSWELQGIGTRALKNIMMKIGPNAPALDGLCIWMMQISSMYIGHEGDFNFILISFCFLQKKTTINIYHLLILNKLLTSSEHRNRNKPFYIYKVLIQWQKADPASSPWPMYMHESNAIHIQRSSRACA